MVRKLRTCALCDKRFISVSETSEHCKKCLNAESIGISSSKQLSRQKLRDFGPHQEVVSLCDSPRSKTFIDGNNKQSPIQNDVEQKRILHSRTNQQIENTNNSQTIHDDELLKSSCQNIRSSPIHSSEEKRNINCKKKPKLCSRQEDDNEAMTIVTSKQTISSTEIDVESVQSEADSDLSENLTLAQLTTNVGKRNELPSSIPSKIHSPTLTSDDSLRDEIKSQQVSAQGDICFICGCDFKRISTGFKGRLNHIKRCSKKAGVTAHTMRYDDDNESFQRSISNKIPSTTENNEWHGDAEQDLKLAEEGGAVQQTSLTSFFATQVKSLNNVLMAGAKRLAKTNEVQIAAAKTGKNGTKRKRGFYTKRSGACPSYKKIPGTDFVCDGFMYARASLTNNYFLTHFHSDHYGGISKTWNEGIIYCSLPTANLVAQRLGVDRKYLHPLGMNSPVVIQSKGKPVTVTLIDANHCPGAVMFLFQVGNRCILHVGDFRWNRARMSKELKDFSTMKMRLDDIFLDTTYCNKKYKLPTQEDTINATVEIAEEEMASCRKTGTKVLMLFGAYTIGKERLYLAVAERLGMKVYVDKTRYQTLSALNWPSQLMQRITTDKSSTNIWVVPLGHINFKKLSTYAGGKAKALDRKQHDRIIAFRPTGWSHSGDNRKIINTRCNGIFTIHSVPYSEHSSFPELVDCISCLNPKRYVS